MRLFLSFVLLVFSSFLLAQDVPPTSLPQLQTAEDSMKVYARQMIREQDTESRLQADSIFVRMLVQALRVPHSFYYPFDSIETVSCLYAPDSSFRIFSWQLSKDENYYRQRGAIQMNTTDGSLKLFPLLDVSEFTNAPADSVRGPQNWIGAIYYGIVVKEHNNKKVYTLLGFDDNSYQSTKKWLEVLTFDAAGRPVFGGPFFFIKNDSTQKVLRPARFELEYKKDGRARMNFDQELDMIVYDHLISEDNTPERKHTLIPDGDYDGFKWVDGHWQHITKIFDFKLKDGDVPVPEPIKDKAGKSNEEKLREQSEKNARKAGENLPVMETEPVKSQPVKKKKNGKP